MTVSYVFTIYNQSLKKYLISWMDTWLPSGSWKLGSWIGKVTAVETVAVTRSWFLRLALVQRKFILLFLHIQGVEGKQISLVDFPTLKLSLQKFVVQWTIYKDQRNRLTFLGSKDNYRTFAGGWSLGLFIGEGSAAGLFTIWIPGGSLCLMSGGTTGLGRALDRNCLGLILKGSSSIRPRTLNCLAANINIMWIYFQLLGCSMFRANLTLAVSALSTSSLILFNRRLWPPTSEIFSSVELSHVCSCLLLQRWDLSEKVDIPLSHWSGLGAREEWGSWQRRAPHSPKLWMTYPPMACW